MKPERTLTELLLAEVRRHLVVDGLGRCRKCLSELSEAEIWLRPNEHSNSVGNLVLHLCGNVGQWIVSGLGNRPDTRQRQLEFDERGPVPASELLLRLESVMTEVDEVLNEITPDKLMQPIEIQGFKENGLSVLVHVVEHFSYHVGQITYFVKWKKDMDTNYYGDQDLDITG